MNYAALTANKRCKVTKNSGFLGENTRAICVPRRFLSRCDLISLRYGISFVCINAQVHVDRMRKRERKRQMEREKEGGRENEKERERNIIAFDASWRKDILSRYF